MQQHHAYQVVEMSAAASVMHVVRNIETGNSTQWDLDYLKSIGVKLSPDLERRIALGLTTAEDGQDVWDAAFSDGAI